MSEYSEAACCLPTSLAPDEIARFTIGLGRGTTSRGCPRGKREHPGNSSGQLGGARLQTSDVAVTNSPN
jgi:hypothetical protein